VTTMLSREQLRRSLFAITVKLDELECEIDTIGRSPSNYPGTRAERIKSLTTTIKYYEGLADALVDELIAYDEQLLKEGGMQS